MWPTVLCLGFLTLMIRAEVADHDWSEVEPPVWKRYLEKFDAAAIESDSTTPGNKGGSGSGEKPHYLYSARAIRTLATLEEQVYTVVKAYSKESEFQHHQHILQRYVEIVSDIYV